MVFLHEVVACPESDEVGIVGGRWYGYAPRTTHIRVAQLIGEHLKFVGVKSIVVPQYVVVGRPTCTLT